METKIIRLESDEGPIFMEIEGMSISGEDGFEFVGSDEPDKKNISYVKNAFQSLKPIVHSLFQTVKSMEPTEVELEMGIKFTTEGNVIVAKAGSEANFNVKLKWTENKQNEPK